MNNKKGGAGAKILLVLILMIASAIGGAIGYRTLDGKMAVKDALREIEDIDAEDYDTEDSTTILDFVEETTKKINEAKSRKDVYDILEDFGKDISRIKTKKEKEAEALIEQAQQAQNERNRQSEEGYGQSSNEDENSGGLKLFKSDDGTQNNTEETGEEEEDSSGGLFNFS